MATRISVLVLAALLAVTAPSLAWEITKPDSTADKHAHTRRGTTQPGATAPGQRLDEPSAWQSKLPAARRTPRRLSDNPYSVKHRPMPAMNSPYSRQRRNTNIYRDERGRALGYSIRRPDGRTQYRQFRGRGSKPSLPFGWQ